MTYRQPWRCMLVGLPGLLLVPCLGYPLHRSLMKACETTWLQTSLTHASQTS